MRKSGILMPIASLPSKQGIGDFGASAYEFAQLIKKSGFKLWQILPLNALGYGNSPYQCYSSKAMDELYINLDMLCDDGLLAGVEEFQDDSTSIQYDEVRVFKNKYLKEAYSNFKPNDEYELFLKNNTWVRRYALFVTLKKQNKMLCWNEWDIELRNPDLIKDEIINQYKDEIEYECFIQYLLLKQWNALREYVNGLGIEIMGDIPFYVGLDSDDVWSNQNQFLLDEEGHPTFVAGVPPDYFSEVGQRWGNPIYNWELMEQESFAFWMDRLEYTSTLFDVVRIDHFRAFDTYWKIPSTCPTAIEGEWIEAPGYKFFDTLFRNYPDMKIVAEDLGMMRPEVYDLRDHYNLMGMRIVQYSWNSRHMSQDRENLLIYTGTHDNEPMRSWFGNMSREEKIKSRQYLRRHGFKQPRIIDSFIEYTLASNARIAILSMVDILNCKIDCRINAPGTVGSPNWEWKMKNHDEFRSRIPTIKRQIQRTKR
ncbi:MAG: 4-alpha-glucanotransferase [Erysipelotrichaceae bacterium]|uniref:4-alpha-glucanotransferase n=1 Tax=Anaerorhabdus sp. TaxID=1872524 RepID=UPI002FCB1C43